jgi:hypothetical protein
LAGVVAAALLAAGLAEMTFAGPAETLNVAKTVKGGESAIIAVVPAHHALLHSQVPSRD